MKYLLALDQGTSSSRSIVFDAAGNLLAQAQAEITQVFPHPGWVEHDAQEIWATQLATAREAIRKANVDASEICSIGIANQRETAVIWDRSTGIPIHHALVWQDRRGDALCKELGERGRGPALQRISGLCLDPYFSASKIRWMLDSIPQARVRACRGELAFGTIDTWLLWNLTGGAIHATDPSNASRTMLYDIHASAWSHQALDVFEIPERLLPVVQPSSSLFGHTVGCLFGKPIAIAGIAGDQQAALFGQACFSAGQAKNTYGTGCFLLAHTGEMPVSSQNGLLTTRAAQVGAQTPFALEGSVFMGGATIQWLRDGLGIIKRSSDVEALAASVPDSGGVTLVPAFTGLGAPYWAASARGAILGMTRGTTAAHIARAALDSIAYQTAALVRAMNQDAQQAGTGPLRELRVDGGACVNNALMQLQADLLGIPVLRPKVVETTALGAAYLAGLGCGLYSEPSELAQHWQLERMFEPKMPPEVAAAHIDNWEHAVRQTLAE